METPNWPNLPIAIGIGTPELGACAAHPVRPARLHAAVRGGIIPAMDIFVAIIVFGAIAGFALAFGEPRGWSPPGARAWRWAATLAALVAAVRLAVMVAEWLPADSVVNSYDFQVFYTAAQAARAQAPLYDLPGIRRDPGEVVVYRHAPVGAVLFAPWTLLPYHTAINAWRLLNVAVYALALWVLLRHFGLTWRSPLGLGLAAVWFVSTPSRDSLALGQWDALFILLSLVSLILLTTRRDRDLSGGAALALPIMLKFYPALLLLGPFVARRWRTFAGCLLGGVILLGGGLLAGWENTVIYLRDVIPAVGGGTLYAENQTLYAFIGRLLASDLRGNGVGATYPVALTRALALALSLPILLVTALAVWRRGGGTLGMAVRFVLPIPAALLLIPTAWAHYVTLALLPLAVLAVALSRQPAPWYLLALFAVAAVLIPLGSERDVWQGAGPHDGPIRLLLTYKVYGLLSLWAALCLLSWRIRSVPYGGPERRRMSLLFGRSGGW